MCAAVTSSNLRSKKGTNKNKIAPLEPTYKAPNAINWKPKFDAWNAILMAVNAKLAHGAEKPVEKTAEKSQFVKPDKALLENNEEPPVSIEVGIFLYQILNFQKI